ncbi:unnamed protein product [Gulo gulo]|uniref:Uncharacterized protein n=1 Tax=Gulo gulo TaxID=48420 RepID=A0A9X9MDV5_GULGU|nr:unnamed protein product [Gulo gulo]
MAAPGPRIRWGAPCWGSDHSVPRIPHDVNEGRSQTGLQSSPGTYHEQRRGRNWGWASLLGYSTEGKREVSVRFPCVVLVGVGCGV